MSSIQSAKRIAKDDFSKAKLTVTLQYLFGAKLDKNVEKELEFRYSPKTGRLRYVLNRKSGEILFTFRPDGSIAPTIFGAKAIINSLGRSSPCIVQVVDGVAEFIARGKTVFCKHVTRASDDLRAADDVLVTSENGDLLAVGRAILPGNMMKQFKRGVAVKVREGILENVPNEHGQ